MAFQSQLGITASTLGEFLVLGVNGNGVSTPDLSVDRRPLVIVDGQIRQIDDNDNLLVNGLSLPGEALLVEVMEDNVTIYVDLLGNDDTGDGSISSPYQTIERAAEHYLRLAPANFTVTVHVNSGVHMEASRFQVSYPYGANLVFEGDIETLASPTLSNIDGSASTDASYAFLRYFDFDLDVSGTGAEEGHFVWITTATGGTRPEIINGLHRIESVVSGTATCRVWQNSGAAALLPSGSVTVTNVRLLKSVLKFTADSQGVFLNGISAMGEWNNLVIEGNATAYANLRAGVEMFGGASIRSTQGLFIHEWGNAGLQSFGEGVVYLQAGGISKIRSVGLRSLLGAFTRFTSATINGCGSQGLNLTNTGAAVITSAKVHSVGGGAGVLCERSSRVVANGSSFTYPGGSTDIAFLARDLGVIDAESTITTGYATAYSPTTPFANDFGLVLTDVSPEGLQPSKVVIGNGSGSNYNLTTSAAEVDEGTDSAIVLDQAGTYLIKGTIELFYSNADYSGGSDQVRLKLRRTNNTAADLSGSEAEHQTFNIAGFTGSVQHSTWMVSYTTASADDRIALFVMVDTLPGGAGTLQVIASQIVAERIA